MPLTKHRQKIDDIDSKLVKLLNERAEAAMEIGKVKIKNNKPIFASDREAAVYKKVRRLNKGPLHDEALEAIYREIMSCSLSLEKSLRIAYLGPEATFTHLAAIKKFGTQLSYIPSTNISTVFQKVEKGECDYGVVPVENSIEGAVNHTFDLLADSELKICSQIMLDISHHLMAKCSFKSIKNIYSKAEAIGQCRQWINQNMPDANLVEVASTAEAAQKAAKTKTGACIASEMAAQVYKLNILRSDIQDKQHNITRFLILSNNDVEQPTGHDRTSIVFSIRDKVGALHDMLEPFYEHRINLTKIESRPLKKKAWDYYFFVDFKGHRSEDKVQKALTKLDSMCKFLKILGSYPVNE